ncbi:MAG: (2Fe-2S) ferredoxin domain-containing protein [Microcoleaceae cyanobacterium MO_207.B10]|nr:(2Fe-2S) ferredoxin domain-containing protein [Microcoleaceae cyanobacterium MO_207.B10]
MSKSNKQITKFSLEGQIQEVTIKDGYKLKYVEVATPAGNNYTVKIAKHLRENLSSVLIPGLGVKVTGERKVYRKTGEEKLKAYSIIPDVIQSKTVPCQKNSLELIENLSSEVIELQLPEEVDRLSTVAVEKLEPPHDGEHICKKSQEGTEGTSKCARKKAHILVCQKSDCQKRGASKVCKALSETLSDRGLEDQVTIKKTGCLKKCKAGPNLVIMPNKARYSRIKSAEIPDVIEKHFAL